MSRTVKSTRVGRPRAGEASDFEPRILARTWELFVNGGYSAITYEALSRLERMSKQTIYSRFESKEALFRAAAERRLLAWSEETARAIQMSRCPESLLRKAARFEPSGKRVTARSQQGQIPLFSGPA